MVDDDKANEEAGKDTNESDSGFFHDQLPPPPDFSYSRPSLSKNIAPSGTTKLAESSGVTQANRPGLQSAGRSLAAGMTLAGSLLGGMTLGIWLDSRFGKPGSYMWSVLMTGIGAVGGFTNLIRVLNSGKKRDFK
jgi:hypothetical protein